MNEIKKQKKINQKSERVKRTNVELNWARAD